PLHDALPICPTNGALAGGTPGGTRRNRRAGPHRSLRLRRGGRADGLVALRARVRRRARLRRSTPLGPRVHRAGRPAAHARGVRRMSGPMAGVRIVDLSIALTGPYAAALLADQGADVIKVERPG